jgi:hypothetical protein
LMAVAMGERDATPFAFKVFPGVRKEPDCDAAPRPLYDHN